MTQPDYDIPVSLDTSGVVSGAQQGEAAVQGLQAALAGLTIGTVAASRGLDNVSTYGRRGLFASASMQSAIDLQKEMSGLAATSAVTGQSLRSFRGDVEGLARSMPGGTQQAVATTMAVQQLGLSARNQQGQIRGLSREFTNLGAAVGEVPSQIGTQFGQLNRELASLDPSRVARFADVLTTLHAESGASASGILSFSQAIGPVAQAAGLGEASILGISTAFTKLGDDGGAAATAINKILTDLNTSVREGSNTMVAYANATGLTVKQFRALYEANPAQALTRVTQALANAGPTAPYLLQTLGLDPTRTQRALLELSQSGGLGATINTAVGAVGNGSTQKAASAAFNNVDDKMQQLTSTAGQLGTALDQPLLRPLGAFLGLVQGLVQPLAALAGSPAGQIAMAGAAYGGLGLLGASKVGAVGLRGVSRLSSVALGYGAIGSGPVAATVAGNRVARLGEDALYAEGSWRGGRYNPMIAAGLGHTDEAGNPLPFGGPTMASTNRKIFQGSLGAFSRYSPTSSVDDYIAGTAGQSRARRVFGAVAGPASYGYGGYLRMARAPFDLAGQNAVDRHFPLTSPGGPTRTLMDSLKDGGWKDPKATGAAIGDFSKSITDASKVMPRFTSSISQYLLAAGGFGAQSARGVLGVGGSLLSRAGGAVGGAIMGNPTLAIAGAGIAAYSLYRSSTGAPQRDTAGDDPSQVYSVVNEYRDALGLAGVATVNLTQELNAAATSIAKTITTFSQAKTVSPADLQAFGLPNAKKTIQRYTGSTAQVAAQVSAVYAGTPGGMTPQDMQGVKQDLYNQGYSSSQIDAILSHVTTGSTISSAQIGSLIGHVNANTSYNKGSIWDQIKQSAATSANTLLNGDSSGWATIGRSGGGSPFISTAGKSTLAALSKGIQQTANVNRPKGENFAVGTELNQANQAIADALKTKDANTVVATEQALTRALTGKALGDTSAADVQQAGSLTNLLGEDGVKVYGRTIAQWSQAGAFGAKPSTSTPYQVSALQGGARSMFGQFYGGGRGGIQGLTARAIGTGVEDPATVSSAAIAIVTKLSKAGDSLNQIATAADKSLNTTSSGQNALQLAVMQRAQMAQQVSQIGMTQGQQLSSQMQQGLSLYNVNGTDANSVQQRAAGQQEYTQAYSDLEDYYKQRVMAQFNYQIQSGRATYDYQLQQSRADQDYQRQSLRNDQDYYVQKTRAAQDYQRQLNRSIQDAESQMYDPYTRISAQPVFDAGDLAANLTQQNQALAQQKQNLDKARSEGLTKSAVDVLGLASTSNAQQLQQLIDEFASDPHMIQVINNEIQKRGGLTKGLYTDSGNVSYERQKQDYETAVGRSKADFDLQSSRLQQDFTTQTSRAAQDFSTQMARMSQDFADQDLEITGSMTTLHGDLIKVLHGQAVDFKSQLHNTLADTLSQTKAYIPKLNNAFAGINSTPATGSSGQSSANAAENGGVSSIVGGKISKGQVRDGRYYIGGTTAKDRAFIWSELGQESGNYKAVNSKSGALGAYQILPGNIASWSKDILGHSITTEQFMNSPRLQDLIAQGMLMRDVKSSGFGGAASIWYSGSAANRHSTASQHGYPSVESYVDSVLARMLQAPESVIKGAKKHHHKTTPATNSHSNANLRHATTSAYISTDQARQITSGGLSNAMAVDARRYHYDSRTQILGEVKVVASSPTELGDQLAAKQRRDNLTAPKGVSGGRS